jgi:hypothetical protein
MSALEDVARVNPRLAVALLRSNPQLPQVYSLTANITNGVTESPITVQFDSPVTEDFWVYGIEYSIDQPNYLPGAMFRHQEIYFNGLLGGSIVASFTVRGGVGLPWLFSSAPLPVQALAKPMTGPGGENRYGCCSNFVMFFPQVLVGTFWLTRNYDDFELPLVLTVTFTGLTLGCKNYGGLTIKQAQDILRSEFDVQTPAIQAG